MENWALVQRQSLPLAQKIRLSEVRIQQWYEHWEGNVYIAFSGGKDSTVLLHLVRSMYPEVPAVFANTGLEAPEILKFVKSMKNIVWLVPKINFKKVLETYGFPVVSKQIAQKLSVVQKNPKSYISRYYMTGVKKNGEYKRAGMISNKWKYLADAPFKISEKCCHIMKKKPFHDYEKNNGNRKPYIGEMASDSRQRMYNYLKYECNSFSNRKILQSNPLGFWLEEDIWSYIKTYNIPYAEIYNMGWERTGCMFCMFGIHFEKEPNRFQRMQTTHPKQYKYCIYKLGLGAILDYMNIPYTYKKKKRKIKAKYRKKNKKL